MDHYSKPGSPGSHLVENISELYAWYAVWNNSATLKNPTYFGLARLMRIIKTSCEGGAFLTPNEQESISQSIHLLRENLFQCKIRVSELPFHLIRIIEKIVETSPKAKLVDTIMKLEFAYFDQDEMPKEEICQKVKEQTGLIMKKITPELPDICATAIEKNLEALVRSRASLEDLSEKIRLSYKHWL